ncbi:MAG: carotenoid biosynthesis protein [Candidatus Rokubacteria bacterium]|nr:carotenoid biosynthesis protein [Candidatus Rokubacteria bacterium]MBI2015199.1 carotenoid biosynthesis protein [Candidatus Rokubacteria bacterium]MBI2156709.1 carotenoid biosynthesis protein [Candidatus Rokubacteria bacterium]MBI4255909.1 carotenoid biosynthesis protein [Candidatus Rokubacteria bacterium]
MDLIAGTLALRPYVFGFLAAFLAAGAADLGWRRTLLFGGIVWPVAWLGEFASTRVGIPFGRYHYTGLTRGRELYVADVPLMDSLSFAFLAYAAFCLARAALARRRPSRGSLALLSGMLMMALDVVIDPLAVRGDRWFLERIFYYPEGGLYFGVPLSNFAGWVVVGTVGVGLYLAAARTVGAASASPARGRAGMVWPGIALYYAVLGFNLAVTVWIGEWLLAGLGGLVHAAVALALRFVHRHAVPGEVPGAGSRGVQHT